MTRVMTVIKMKKQYPFYFRYIIFGLMHKNGDVC